MLIHYQQITYIESVNIAQGHGVIGSTTGDGSNFSYQLTEVLKTQIEIPTSKQTN